MAKKRMGALNVSFRRSFIDHIAPLASLLDIPLFINDEKNAELTARYYPETAIRFCPDFEFRIKELADEFDVLLSCDYWGPRQQAAFRMQSPKKPKFVFCPHGQSDKGYNSSFLHPYAEQEIVLLYGDLMREMLVDLQLWDKVRKSAVVGNFRKRYYELHWERLLKAVDEEIFSKLNRSNRTVFFAPTWNDFERSGTFFEAGEKLLHALPSDWNLVLKVHPNLPDQDPALYCRLGLIEEKRPNFLLIEEFPPIYPILERVDVYLGDYSSIGYDCLAFDKPMFFFQKPHLPRPRLHACGKVLDLTEDLFQAMESDLPDYREAKRELYNRAFSPIEDLQLAIEAGL